MTSQVLAETLMETNFGFVQHCIFQIMTGFLVEHTQNLIKQTDKSIIDELNYEFMLVGKTENHRGTSKLFTSTSSLSFK